MFKEESEATKISLEKSRKEKADRKAAILEAKKKYEASAAASVANRNLMAAKLNAQTQSSRAMSDAWNASRERYKQGERDVKALWGLAAGRETVKHAPLPIPPQIQIYTHQH